MIWIDMDSIRRGVENIQLTVRFDLEQRIAEVLLEELNPLVRALDNQLRIQ